MGRTLFLREYASFISDEMITELMDYPRNMMLSIDIIPVAMDEAVSDIRKRIMSVESDITRWQQRQNQSNNFTANIPYGADAERNEGIHGRPHEPRPAHDAGTCHADAFGGQPRTA